MTHRRSLRMAALIVLALLGLLLYADLKSVHQIYRISESMINNAAAQSRQNLIADRDRRDREERRHKAFIEIAMTVDVGLFLWVGMGVLGWPRRAANG